jgi:hypothetical protein
VKKHFSKASGYQCVLASEIMNPLLLMITIMPLHPMQVIKIIKPWSTLVSWNGYAVPSGAVFV